MKPLSIILLQALNDSGTAVGTLVTVLIVFAVSAAIFLIIRSILLWYWKVDVILNNQDQQTVLLTQLLEQKERKAARVNYYKFLATGDKKQAYESLLYIIFNDLLDKDLKGDERRVKYDKLKERYSKLITDLGYEFPTFPF